jgi:hypothetical protein
MDPDHSRETPSDRLLRWAGQVPEDLSDAAMPPGFATRLVARLKSEPTGLTWDRLVWSSAAFAAAVCLACVGWEWTAPLPDDDTTFAAQFSNLPFHP